GGRAPMGSIIDRTATLLKLVFENGQEAARKEDPKILVPSRRPKTGIKNPPFMKPSTGITGCCARARLALAASSRPPPPTRAMNSRRFMSSMGDFLPYAY